MIEAKIKMVEEKELKICRHNWATGIKSDSKMKEDRLLKDKQPGTIGEWIVKEKLIEFKDPNFTPSEFETNPINDKKFKRYSIACNWLGSQDVIHPDIITNKIVFEIKTLRFYGTGTAPEKIDGIFRKYSNVYQKTGKPVVIVFVAKQQIEKTGLMYLNAFNNGDYSNNTVLEAVVPIYKQHHFHVIGYKDLTKEWLNKIIQN